VHAYPSAQSASREHGRKLHAPFAHGYPSQDTTVPLAVFTPAPSAEHDVPWSLQTPMPELGSQVAPRRHSSFELHSVLHSPSVHE
jgi:hypothetical protein